MVDNFESCYRLCQSRDRRYDGIFFSAVSSTGVYCRPSCPARMPKRANVRFFTTAAAAQDAGFRAYKRCRPDAAPGSPEWNWRADTAARAMRLIAEGTVDREGVRGLAGRVGFSERHLRRLLADEVGTGPVALARAQRAHTARLLIESTTLPFTDIAYAAGFGSVRQFNDTIRSIFAFSPSQMRRRSCGADGHAPAAVEVRLSCREPFDGDSLLRFLARRAVPGVEEVSGGTYRGALRLAFGTGIVELTPELDAARCRLHLDDFRDLGAAVARCRHLLDLDADPVAIADALVDEDVIGPFIRARPGLRLPGCLDGEELVLRAVLGERLSSPADRAGTAHLVATFGTRVPRARGAVTHLFPRARDLAEADLTSLPGSTLPHDTLRRVAAQLADGQLLVDAGADSTEVLPRLHAIPGIGAAAVAYVAMRGFHEPDAFIPGDPAPRLALRHLGHAHDRQSLSALQQRWRPWRAYAALHLVRAWIG